MKTQRDLMRAPVCLVLSLILAAGWVMVGVEAAIAATQVAASPGDWVQPKPLGYWAGYTSQNQITAYDEAGGRSPQTKGSTALAFDSNPATAYHIEYTRPTSYSSYYYSSRDFFVQIYAAFSGGVHLKGITYDYRYRGANASRSTPAQSRTRIQIETPDPSNGYSQWIWKDVGDGASFDPCMVRNVRIDHRMNPWKDNDRTAAVQLDIYEIRGIAADVPTAPKLLQPPNGLTTTEPQLTFSWSDARSRHGISHYVFELANNRDFASPFVSERRTDTSIRPPLSMPAGSYFWRATAYSRTGEKGDTGEVSRLVIGPKSCWIQPETGNIRYEIPPGQNVRVTSAGNIRNAFDSNSLTAFNVTANYYVDPKVDAILQVDFPGATTMTGVMYDYEYRLKDNPGRNEPQNSIQMDIYTSAPAAGAAGSTRWEWLKVGDGRVFPPKAVKSVKIRHTFTVWGQPSTTATSMLDIYEVRGINTSGACEPAAQTQQSAQDTVTIYASQSPMRAPAREVPSAADQIHMLHLTLLADSTVALNGLRTTTYTYTGRLRDVTAAALWLDGNGDGREDTKLAETFYLNEDGSADFSRLDLTLKKGAPSHLIVTHDFRTDGRDRYHFRTRVGDTAPIVATPKSWWEAALDAMRGSVSSTATPAHAIQLSISEKVRIVGLPVIGDTVTLRPTFNFGPYRPRPISPTDGAESVPTTVELMISRFSDPENDSQMGTHWQVTDASGMFVNERMVANWIIEGGTATTADTSLRFPRGLLRGKTGYAWRVRVRDSKGAWSEWSEARTFTTGADPLDQPAAKEVVMVRPEIHVQIDIDNTYTVVNNNTYVNGECDDDDDGHEHGRKDDDKQKPQDRKKPALDTGPSPTPRQPKADDRFKYTLANNSTGKIDVMGPVDYDQEVSPAGQNVHPKSSFKYGLFTYNVSGVPIGGSVTIAMTMPENVPAGAKYYLWNESNKAWIDMTPQLGSLDGDSVVELTLRDGGPGDLDGTANGRIVDPGGIVFPESVSTYEPTPATDGSVGGAAAARAKGAACVITGTFGHGDFGGIRRVRDVFMESAPGRALVRTYYGQ